MSAADAPKILTSADSGPDRPLLAAVAGGEVRGLREPQGCEWLPMVCGQHPGAEAAVVTAVVKQREAFQE